MRLRRLWLIGAIFLAALVVSAMALSGGWLSPIARREVLGALQKQYPNVSLGALHVALFPRPTASGEELIIGGEPGAAPLIRLRKFEAETGWLSLLGSPRHIKSVHLEGLEIHIASHNAPGQSGGKARAAPKPSFLIEQIVADGSSLEILPKSPGKPPLVFELYKLTFRSVGLNRPMNFRGELRNAKPPGLIHTEGEFGPWNFSDAGQTPVTGRYEFHNADLGVFKGIAGHLNSTGEFRGALSHIEANGSTDTPDFMVQAGGHRMDLKASFSATIDGTDGDTLLHPVNAKFGSTSVLAQGSITGVKGTPGKTVSLQGEVQNGDLADVLRLGVKSEPPPMTGRISFTSAIRIPPGDRDIAGKLYLNGRFDIESGRFTGGGIEEKVSSLSERGRGNPQAAGKTRPAANLRGRFVLDNGVIRLTGLAFHLPGAEIQLNGTYALLTERLDFHGTATMEAKLSQMTTGISSFLLKALDPIFHKNKAGAVIPISISGTREKPSVSLDLKKRRFPSAPKKDR